MENIRALRKYFIALVLLVTGPVFVFAYDDRTTHPALTQEIIKLFNLKFPERNISDTDAERIIQGSIDEDKDGRWTRHFYDPVHNWGLSYLGIQWQSAKGWVGDTVAQATFKTKDIPSRTLYGRVRDIFSGATDYSWERGIYEYAWGDKQRGLATLGHTLHLIEDMSVPDHTRNDPHPGLGKHLHLPFLEHHDISNSSPYESFAVFNRGSLHIVEELKSSPPIIKSSIDEYFDGMARYSNGNFFSRDTILSPQYSEPRILRERTEKLANGKTYLFGYGENIFGEEHKLVKIERNFGETERIYSLDDSANAVVTDYFSRLSRQAILHGAGLRDEV